MRLKKIKASLVAPGDRIAAPDRESNVTYLAWVRSRHPSGSFWLSRHPNGDDPFQASMTGEVWLVMN